MEKLTISKVYNNVKFGLFYVLLSLIIGECHPFSRETMYNTFPNLAVVCYLRGEKGVLVPVKKNFSYSIDAITHNYWNILEKTENKKDNRTHAEFGSQLWNQIAPHAYNSTVLKRLTIHRMSYFLRNDTIIQNDTVLYQIP